MAHNLTKLEPILKKDNIPSYNINFSDQIKKFKDVIPFVNNKLILVSPFMNTSHIKVNKTLSVE